MYTIAFGCDPNASELKKALMLYCEKLGHTVVDLGSDDPIYANTAIRVAQYVVSGQADRGVLLCGTGIGMSIAANKVKGASAALLSDAYSAERASLSNDANIACIGAFTVGLRLAEGLLGVWLNAAYKTGSASQEKVDRIKEYDKTRE